jgi:hypothetical protein
LRTRLWVGAISAAVSLLLSNVAHSAPLLPSIPFGAPTYTVTANNPGGFDGKLFYTTGANAALVLPGGINPLELIPQPGASNVIADKDGAVIWRYTPPAGETVANFRTQTYRGKPVLTWWEGADQAGHGAGRNVIADEDYNIIETLTPGDDLSSDVHEFRLTPDGKALITSYREETGDLSALGGPREGTFLNCIATVIDVATKKVITRWNAREHVPFADSVWTPGLVAALQTPDPFHMNSIDLDPHGNLVISLRNTSTIYNIDPTTGEIDWQLGGKRSTFEQGPGSQFAFQHDAEFSDANTLRLFDNSSNGPTTTGPSTVRWIHLDPAAHKATLERTVTHPLGLVAFAAGNAQGLPNGNTLVNWGSAAHMSEFSPTGALIFDAAVPQPVYRAYLDPWPGK